MRAAARSLPCGRHSDATRPLRFDTPPNFPLEYGKEETAMSDAAFADFTRSFGALSDCKSRPHAVSAHCQNAKGFHTQFLPVVRMQMPIHTRFQRIVRMQTGFHTQFQCIVGLQKGFHTEFQRVVGLQKPSTRDFSTLSAYKSHPHAVSVYCQNAKGLPHGISVHCQIAKGIHTRFRHVVERQTSVSMQKGACGWFPRNNNARFYTNKTRRCV